MNQSTYCILYVAALCRLSAAVYLKTQISPDKSRLNDEERTGDLHRTMLYVLPRKAPSARYHYLIERGQRLVSLVLLVSWLHDTILTRLNGQHQCELIL